MANTNRPGFRPVGHLNGSKYNGQANRYVVLATDGTALMVGDLVQMDTTDSTNAGPYPAVKRLAAGDSTAGNIVGVVVGMAVDPTNLNTPVYRAASTARNLLVCDAPDVVLEAALDDTSASAVSIGLNVAVTTTAGSTTTGASGMQLDASTATTTAELPVKIIGLVDSPGNELTSAYARALVVINKHLYRGAQVGA